MNVQAGNMFDKPIRVEWFVQNVSGSFGNGGIEYVEEWERYSGYATLPEWVQKRAGRAIAFGADSVLVVEDKTNTFVLVGSYGLHVIEETQPTPTLCGCDRVGKHRTDDPCVRWHGHDGRHMDARGDEWAWLGQWPPT